MTALDRLNMLSTISSSVFRTEIEKYERKVDDVKDAMLNYAYAAKLNYKQFAHTTDIAYLGDNILDSCEDSADRLLGIMLSIAT